MSTGSKMPMSFCYGSVFFSSFFATAILILISCKPQIAHTILHEPGIKEALDGKLLISILAGLTMGQITKWVLPTTRVVRAMPNTPCKVRPPSIYLQNLGWAMGDDHFFWKDPWRDDSRFKSSFLPTRRKRPHCHTQDILFHWTVSVPGREAFRRVYGPLRIGAGFCLYLSGSHDRWWCYDGTASRGGLGISSTKRETRLHELSRISWLPHFLALQGAARMVLQGGTHPAQLKDSVTSKCGWPCARHGCYSTVASPGWMHHCRIIGIRRWKGSFDDCKRYSNCNWASQRVGTVDDEVNAVKRFANLIQFSAESVLQWSVYLIHGTYRRAKFWADWRNFQSDGQPPRQTQKSSPVSRLSTKTIEMFERRSTLTVHLSTGESTILVWRVKNKNAHVKRFTDLEVAVIIIFGILFTILVTTFLLKYICRRNQPVIQEPFGRRPYKNNIVSYYNPTKIRRATMTKSTMVFGPHRLGRMRPKSFSPIRISPSRPVVFGAKEDTEHAVKVQVVLTPPTPAKEAREGA